MALAAGLQFGSGPFTAILGIMQTAQRPELCMTPTSHHENDSVTHMNAGHANHCAECRFCFWLVVIENYARNNEISELQLVARFLPPSSLRGFPLAAGVILACYYY